MAKEKRYRTYPHRWGEGKVHRYLWDSVNKVRYVACSTPYRDPHGKVVDDTEPVTCKKCQ